MKTYFLKMLSIIIKKSLTTILFLSDKKSQTSPIYNFADRKKLYSLKPLHINYRNIDSNLYSLKWILTYRNSYIKDSVWALKYNRNPHAIYFFSSILYDEIIAEQSDRISSFALPCTLLTISSSAYILKEKNWDQMSDIASTIYNFPGSKLFIEYIPHFFSSYSYSSSLHQRLSHVKGRSNRIKLAKERIYISPSKNEMKSKKIYIIDDVTTTGTTLDIAARYCLSSGATSVSCLAICH